MIALGVSTRRGVRLPSRCDVECLLACAHTAIGARLQCCMRTTHGTSGLLSGPLTGSLLHSLNVNLGALEKSEKARNLIFVCRALTAKASLPAVFPRRRSPPLSVPMARSRSRSRRARRPSAQVVPYPGVPRSFVWHEFMRHWRPCLPHAPTASDGRVFLCRSLPFLCGAEERAQ